LNFNNFFLENSAEILWKNFVDPNGPRMTTWGMRIACWIPKTTEKHSEYVVLIACPLQQWLHERASVLRYTYIASLDVMSSVNWLQLVELMWERIATDIYTHRNGLLASSSTRRLCFALRHTCYINQSYVNCAYDTVPVFEYVQK